jgi:hypothetical protein
VICLSGVCVSPLWPSETGFCPPPAQPELTENWEYLPAVPVRQQAGYLPYRHGRPGGRRLRAELWSPSHWCQMAEFRAAGPKNGPVKLLAA